MSDEVRPVLAASNLVLAALVALQDVQEYVIFLFGLAIINGRKCPPKV